MNIDLILGAIGAALGITNFIYWAWWSKRERIIVTNPQLYAEFLPKGTNEPIREGFIVLQKDVIKIEAGCSLVLTNGDKELELITVNIKLDNKACKNLKQFFSIPKSREIDLRQADLSSELFVSGKMLLEVKKASDFKSRPYHYECTEEFERVYGKIRGTSLPDFIQPLLDRLESNYQICYTRYDGKRICWKFPRKWWRNLGKRLWG